jgi:alpha-tubulin suppressor-like RCC1 family protein
VRGNCGLDDNRGIGGGARSSSQKTAQGHKKTNNGVSSINSVAAWGANDQGQLGDGTTTDRHVPLQNRAVSGVVAVAAGFYHSLAG